MSEKKGKSVIINTRITPETKQAFYDACDALGISPSDYIRMRVDELVALYNGLTSDVGAGGE